MTVAPPADRNVRSVRRRVGRLPISGTSRPAVGCGVSPAPHTTSRRPTGRRTVRMGAMRWYRRRLARVRFGKGSTRQEEQTYELKYLMCSSYDVIRLENKP